MSRGMRSRIFDVLLRDIQLAFQAEMACREPFCSFVEHRLKRMAVVRVAAPTMWCGYQVSDAISKRLSAHFHGSLGLPRLRAIVNSREWMKVDVYHQSATYTAPALEWNFGASR